jgi:3-keto-disaccharide hydrolase/BNR repeat protein
MRLSRILFGLAVAACVLFGAARSCEAAEEGNRSAMERIKPKVFSDILWVWGNPEMGKPGSHTVATFAQAASAERARLLGVPNVVMAGHGLPDDERQADAWTREVLGSERVIWEIMADGEGGPPFIYEKRIALARKLLNKYPKIAGILLDDMSTVKVSKGFKPEHIRQIQRLLGEDHASVDIWGVWYTMTFDQAGIEEYIEELDVINMWTWHARDVIHLEKNVAHCEKLFPDKPIVVGLYLYDYGSGRRIPQDLLEEQCKTARKLAHAGRIEGIVFLTITDDAEAVGWAADWIKRVGGEKLGSPTPDRQAESPGRGSLPFRFVSKGMMSEGDTLNLKISDGSDWHMLGGPWKDTEDNLIIPNNVRNLHSRAFYTPCSFTDFTAEFEFNGSYRETGTGTAGLILRATDANHFYMVNFPWGGQQLRAKHFWAEARKVDGDAYQRGLKVVWVPGVPSETDRWYKVRVEATGPTIRVWVDGRLALSVTDDSFKSGAVGLEGYGWYRFRNVKISGKRTPLEGWDRTQEIPVHHFTVGLDSQNMPSGCVAPNGDVLLAAGNKLVRSKDKGRTWGEPETLPEKLGSVTDYGNTMFCTSKGRLIVQMWQGRNEERKVPEILISDSEDNGVTWSDPVPSEVASGWPEIPTSCSTYGPLLETPDGVLLRFLLGGAKEGSKFTNVVTWGSIHCKAYCIRSTDGGKTWSAAIELDRPSWSGVPRGDIPGSLDFTEPTGVAIGNKVTVLIRPVYSPYMWQCWSHDGGVTWDAASRATFPGYAQSMIRTTSGAIVCAHRYPQYCVNISRDDGLHWDAGTIIDYPVWAMGCLVEVEPDVLLSTYMNYDRGKPLLAQLFRVTPEGISPIAPK